MSTILSVSDETFEEHVTRAGGVVLVDFWAEWCGPCKMIAPILEEVAQEFDGKITVVKVNIDENPTSPQRFQVRGIPTLILFKGGEVCATKVGALTKSQLEQFINENL